MQAHITDKLAPAVFKYADLKIGLTVNADGSVKMDASSDYYEKELAKQWDEKEVVFWVTDTFKNMGDAIAFCIKHEVANPSLYIAAASKAVYED